MNPFIAKYYYSTEDKYKDYLFMEFYPNKSLDQVKV